MNYNINMRNYSLKRAFTLAEVLITLGIIGVVAAMTIPTLISNYKKSVVESQLKKVNSTLAQVFVRSEFENGQMGNMVASPENAEKFFVNYWKPYLKISKMCETYSDCGYDSNFAFVKPDGTRDDLVVIHGSRRAFIGMDGFIYIVCLYTVSDATGLPKSDTSIIIVDLNASAPPNKFGQDVFVFEYVSGKSVFPRRSGYTDEEIKADCSATGRGLACAELIRRNGWKIPDDYPIKF